MARNGASLALTLLALLGAFAAAGLNVVGDAQGPPAALFTASLILLVAAAFLLKDPVEEEEETHIERFKREFLLNAVALALNVLFIFLALIESLAIFSRLGFFLTIGVEDFLLRFTAILSLFLIALALVLVLRVVHRSHLEATAARDSLGVFGGAVAGLLGLLGILSGFALLPSPLAEWIAPERAGFVLAIALLAAFLSVRAKALLPTVAEIGDWFEHEPRMRKTGFPPSVIFALALLSVLLVVAAVATNFSAGITSLGLYFLGSGMVLMMLATYAVGVSREVPGLELKEVADARKMRRFILSVTSVVISLTSSMLGLVLLFSILKRAGIPTPVGEILGFFEANFILFIGLAILPLPYVSIVRSRIPTHVEYTPAVRATAWLLSIATFAFIFFALFIGSGIAVGAEINVVTASIVLGVGAIGLSLFVKTRGLLPTIGAMVRDSLKGVEHEKEEKREEIKKNLMVTYVGSLLLVMLMVSVTVLSGLGVVKAPGGGVGNDVLILISLVGAAFAGLFALMRYFQIKSVDPRFAEARKEEDIGKKRLTPDEAKRLFILGGSGGLALILFLIGFAIQFAVIRDVGPIKFEPVNANDFIVAGLLIGLGPYSLYINREASRIRAIDGRFPEFLRDLAESERSGMTLVEAVRTAARGNYGALTGEIRTMAAQVEWGVPFTEALQRFAKRVKTPLIERSVSLIVQASQAGGNVVDVLTAAADDSREIQLIVKERTNSMQIYVMIIYIAFFVFLGVVAVLTSQFIPQVAKAVKGAQGVSVGSITFRAFDENAFRQLFFHAGLIQGFGGGLVAGVMAEGRPVAGMKHAFIMVVVAYVAFRFFVGLTA